MSLPARAGGAMLGPIGDPIQARARGGGVDLDQLLDAAVRPDLCAAPVQAKMSASDLGAAPVAPAASTSALPVQLRARMERSFGADFSEVQVVESDPEVAQMGADAFARGDRLHFAPGQFAPGTPGGDALIGHELAHVVQQREGRVSGGQAKGGVVADPALEREADDVGERAARGEIVGRRGAAAGGATSGVAQLRVNAADITPGTTQVWARCEGKHYYKRATCGAVDPEALTVLVTFVGSNKQATLTLDDLYALDSDELEDYTTGDMIRDTTTRVVRKLGSGRVVSDLANTLGVMSGTSSLVGALSQQEAFYTVGIVGGFGVALGGMGQLTRAITCCDKSGGDRLMEAATGALNVLSGTLGIVSGFMGHKGNSSANSGLGVGSLVAWELVEVLNVYNNGWQALDDLASCKLTYTVASVVLSCVKILGGGGMALGTAFSSKPLLIAGMAVASSGTLASVIMGVIKLCQMGVHHWTNNQTPQVGGQRQDDDSGGHEVIDLGRIEVGTSTSESSEKEKQRTEEV